MTKTRRLPSPRESWFEIIKPADRLDRSPASLMRALSSRVVVVAARGNPIKVCERGLRHDLSLTFITALSVRGTYL